LISYKYRIAHPKSAITILGKFLGATLDVEGHYFGTNELGFSKASFKCGSTSKDDILLSK